MNEANIDFTNGPIAGKMIRFCIPILLSSMFQQLYVLVDSYVISNWISDSALGAVTSCINLVYFVTSFIFGIGQGVCVVISQAYGARKYEWMRKSEGTTVALALISGVILMFCGLVLTRPLLQIMNTPEELMEMSSAYLTIYLCGGIFMLLYNAGACIFQALGDSKHPLYFLMASGICNIVLDFLFVAYFGWGVPGAAFATVISQSVSAICVLVYLFTHAGEQKISLKEVRVHADCTKEILRLGIPGGIESSVVSLANTIVQGSINSLGTAAMAASGAVASIEGFTFLPINAFCSALATFTGQNIGAKSYHRIRKGCRFGLIAVSVLSFGVGMIQLTLARNLLGLFLQSEAAIDLGMMRAIITFPFYPLLGLTHCLAAIFRGAGKPVVSMLAYVLSWGVLRMAILLILLPVWHSFELLCWVYPITWFFSTAGLFIYYWFGKWIPQSEQKLAEAEA